jgi:hypothetical protein
MPEVTAGPERGVEAAADATRRREMFAALAVLALVVGMAVVAPVAHLLAPSPSEQQCADLIDHHLAQASRQQDPAVRDEDVARAQQKVRGERSRLVEVDRCRRQLSAAQVECALRSQNADDLERCLQ